MCNEKSNPTPAPWPCTGWYTRVEAKCFLDFIFKVCPSLLFDTILLELHIAAHHDITTFSLREKGEPGGRARNQAVPAHLGCHEAWEYGSAQPVLLGCEIPEVQNRKGTEGGLVRSVSVLTSFRKKFYGTACQRLPMTFLLKIESLVNDKMSYQAKEFSIF